MKKKVLFILLLILALSMTLLFTGCGGSDTSDNSAEEAVEATEEAAEETEEAETTAPAAIETLEDYFNSNEATQSSLGYDENTGCEISVSGNQLIYVYDYARSGKYTRDQIDVAALKAGLEAEEAKASFGNTAKTLEDSIGISGVEVVTRYCWEDEILAEATFTSATAGE